MPPEKIAELRVKHLEMMQGLVTRMAGYGASFKSFCITVVTAVLGLAFTLHRPAVAATRFEGDRTTKNHAFVQAVAETNARLTAQKLTRDSKVIRELVEAKQLRIAAAMHDISTGKVTFLA